MSTKQFGQSLIDFRQTGFELKAFNQLSNNVIKAAVNNNYCKQSSLPHLFVRL